jgi:uncharacterized protein (DUF2249 family)
MGSVHDEPIRPGSRGFDNLNTAAKQPVRKAMIPKETPSLIGPDKVMDVRPIPCSVKHGLIIRAWLDLPVGGHFDLLNDHDPVPLYYQFSAQWPGAFTWEHLVKGPEEFRVKITKLKSSEAAVAETESACGCRH